MVKKKSIFPNPNVILSLRDSFDSPDTNRSIACSTRGETLSIVSCTASISICHVTDKDKGRRKENRASKDRKRKRYLLKRKK